MKSHLQFSNDLGKRRHVKSAQPKSRTTPPSLPNWGYFYSVSGQLEIPMTELQEPFYAWYDSIAKKSRIVYYTGSAQVIQRGDVAPYGITYKIAPLSEDSSNILNQMTCFQVNGSAGSKIVPQPALPSLIGFAFIGTQQKNNKMCQTWRNITQIENKVNIQTMWVTDDDLQMPVLYETLGHDSFFGIHYDHYFMQYAEFNNIARPAPSVFEVPANVSPCQSFPGPGQSIEKHLSAEQSIHFNPMREYINGDDKHHDELFDKFKQDHKPKYDTTVQEEQKKSIFRQNVRQVQNLFPCNSIFKFAFLKRNYLNFKYTFINW